MRSPLLQLSLATVLCASITVNAQHNHTYDSAAAAHGLDSVDYPGYAYFMEHRHHPSTEANIPMRYQPSQGAPLAMNNGGFESGDFTNWTGTVGDNFASSLGPLQNQMTGIYSGAINPGTSDGNARHSIMMNPGAGTDPTGNFPCVPSGYGTYTARLGNTSANYQGQSISQTWMVSAQDTAFIYSYAVVMYDGTHLNSESCYFMIEVLDSNQNQVFMRQDLSSALPPTYILATGSEFYLPWESDTMNLSAYAGQNLTIRFTASGCIYGGHWCYAYVDCDPNNANTIGIEEHSTSDLQVYPNPSATGLFTVSSSAKTNDEMPVVRDMSGRTIKAVCTPTATGWTIDLTAQSSGTYFVQIQTEDGVKHCHLVR